MINVQPETGSGQSAGNGRYKQLLFESNPWERYKNCNDAVMILHNWYLVPQRFPRAIDYSLHFWEAHLTSPHLTYFGSVKLKSTCFFPWRTYKVDKYRWSRRSRRKSGEKEGDVPWFPPCISECWENYICIKARWAAQCEPINYVHIGWYSDHLTVKSCPAPLSARPSSHDLSHNTNVMWLCELGTTDFNQRYFARPRQKGLGWTYLWTC